MMFVVDARLTVESLDFNSNTDL